MADSPNWQWDVYYNAIPTFHTRADIDKLFKGFELEHFVEGEQDGFEAGGTPKH